MICCAIGSLILIAICSRIPFLRAYAERKRERAIRDQETAAAWRLHEPSAAEEHPPQNLAA